MKIMKLILCMFVFLAAATTSWAIPVVNTTDYNGGDLYGYYTNSGTLISGVQEGNVSNSPAQMEQLESWIEVQMGYDPSFELIETAVSYSPYDNNTGTWSVTNSTAISFYLVKSANAYAVYYVDPADNTGSYSTYDIWRAGYGGNDGVQISHLDGFNPTPVPEPAAMLLLGFGLLGTAVVSRRKLLK